MTTLDFENDFAVFIISHGRPDNVITYNTLRKQGYEGKIFILIDNLDETQNAYVENYGDEVVIFDKHEIAKTFDRGNNFAEMRSTSYPRNANFEVAKGLGIKYFMQLDDDYTAFNYKYNDQYKFCSSVRIKTLGNVWKAMCEYLEKTDAVTLCMSQEGDWIGGTNSGFHGPLHMKRKAMNSFLFKTDRPTQFIGTLNEDVNTYVRHGFTGQLFFTLNQIGLAQLPTQSNAGGMTDAYKANGTYIKSFYTVMYQPSSVKVHYTPSMKRLHHRISWDKTVPKILSEEHRKPR